MHAPPDLVTRIIIIFLLLLLHTKFILGLSKICYEFDYQFGSGSGVQKAVTYLQQHHITPPPRMTANIEYAVQKIPTWEISKSML